MLLEVRYMYNIQRLRKEKGLSQRQLSELSGVNMRTIQFYERGALNIDGAKLSTLIQLATVLECDISDLIEDKKLKEDCIKRKI